MTGSDLNSCKVVEIDDIQLIFIPDKNVIFVTFDSLNLKRIQTVSVCSNDLLHALKLSINDKNLLRDTVITGK
jgi:hypothetical protein